MKIIVSERYQLNWEDVKSWLKTALIFSAPALLVFLASVTEAVPSDWKYATIVIFALNEVVALIRKYVNESKYTVKR